MRRTLIIAGILLPGFAWAQAPAHPPQAQSPAPPESVGHGTDIPGGSATNGVIRPPATTDPGMAKIPPPTAPDAVIRPPETAKPLPPGGTAIIPK